MLFPCRQGIKEVAHATWNNTIPVGGLHRIFGTRRALKIKACYIRDIGNILGYIGIMEKKRETTIIYNMG